MSDPTAVPSGDGYGRAPTVVRARTPLGRRWMDTSVRRKLLSIVALIAVVCAPGVAIGVVTQARLSDAREAVSADLETVDELDTLQGLLRSAAATIENDMITAFRNEETLAVYERAAGAVPPQLDAVHDGLPRELASAEREVLEAVDVQLTALDEVAALRASAAEQMQVEDGVVSLDLGSAEFVPVLSAIQAAVAATADAVDAVERLEEQLGDHLSAMRADVDDYQQLLVQASLGTMIAALVVAAGGAYLVTNGLVRRITRVSEDAERFLRYAPLLPVRQSADEIGQLTDKLLFAGQLLDARREQAVAATRAKDEFLSRVSHELKTPLTAMIGFAQLLEEDPDLSPERQANASEIVRTGHHLHELIEELLGIRAIEAGKLALSVEDVPVRTVVDEAVTLVHGVAIERAVTITPDHPADLTVLADRRRTRDALVDLLEKAIERSDAGGRVVIDVGAPEDAVRFRISDAGPVLSPDERQQLFEPFETAGQATPSGEVGRGLAFTRQVVEAMGGALEVDSTGGRGAVFSLTLPSAPAAASVDLHP